MTNNYRVCIDISEFSSIVSHFISSHFTIHEYDPAALRVASVDLIDEIITSVLTFPNFDADARRTRLHEVIYEAVYEGELITPCATFTPYPLMTQEEYNDYYTAATSYKLFKDIRLNNPYINALIDNLINPLLIDRLIALYDDCLVMNDIGFNPWLTTKVTRKGNRVYVDIGEDYRITYYMTHINGKE